MPLSGLRAEGRKGQNPQDKISPEVYAYFVECNKRLRESAVLTMADTLYRMAEAAGDSTVQCAAVLLKGEYWLHHENLDSLTHYSDQVRRLARQLNRPRYYYQAWSRKVELMMYQYYFQGALEELTALEEEATQGEDAYGIMTSCRLLERYYSLRHNHEAAAHYGKQLVKLVREKNLDPYNLHYHYINYARDLAATGQHKQALKVLDEAMRYASGRDDQRGHLQCVRAEVLTGMGDIDKARRALATADSLLPNAYTMCDNVKAHVEFLQATSSPELALAWIDRYERLTGITSDFEKEKITTLFLIPGREQEAAKLADHYFLTKDSLLVSSQAASFEEFATRMKVNRLEDEKSALYTRYSRGFLWCTLILIAILLGSTLYFFFMWRKVNTGRRELSDMTKRKNEMEDDIHVARGIQMRMLNGSFPEGRRFDLHAHLQPARRVSGDLYDYILDGDKLYFIVGDVSGKGVSASLFMTVATCTFRSFAKHCDNAAEIARVLNKVVCENTVDSMFVTALCGILHLDTGELSLCSAGHHPPIALNYEKDGSFVTSDLLIEIDLPCGIMPEQEYHNTTFHLHPGDAIFVYTDGLPEAENQDLEQYNTERLIARLSSLGGQSAEKIVDSCISDVESFVDGAPQADDITIMAITYLGNGQGVQPYVKSRHPQAPKSLALLLALLLPLGTGLFAQKPHPEVEAYMERCNNMIGEPAIIRMADTLSEMSLRLGDTMGIVSAPVLPFHYYLHTAQEDSMSFYADKAKEIALQYHRTDYYFMVMERWISYQAGRRRYSLALRELDKMHQKALELNDPNGLLSCYKNLSLVYYYKSNFEAALDYARQAIEASRAIKDNDYETGLCYVELARILNKAGRAEECIAELQKVIPHMERRLKTQGEHDMMMALLNSMLTSAQVAAGNIPEASVALGIVDDHMHDGYNYFDIMKAHSDYYCAVGRYNSALQWQNRFYHALGTTHTASYYRDVSEILLHIPGREKEAAQLAYEYARLADSAQAAEQDLYFAQVAADMDLYRLESDNQRMRLRVSYALLTATSLLMVLSIAMAVILWRRRKLRSALPDSTAAPATASDMLRQDFTSTEHYELCASLLPSAQTQGGDLYDFVEMPDGGVLFAIGHAQRHPDVMTYIIRSQGAHLAAPEKVMAHLAANGMEGQLLIGRISPKERSLTLCNAGLQDPIGMTRHGDPASPFTLRHLELAHNNALSASTRFYTSTQVSLQPGDRFFFFTEGLTIDRQRLLALLTTNANTSTQRIIDITKESLPKEAASNDITTLAIVYKQ